MVLNLTDIEVVLQGAGIFNGVILARLMEEINWLRVFAGLLLVLFIPGYTLIQAMFPRRGELDEEFDTLYRVTLGMAMSICIVIIVGFILGNPALGNAPSWGNSDDDKGFFQTFFVTTSLLIISILFFVAGMNQDYDQDNVKYQM